MNALLFYVLLSTDVSLMQEFNSADTEKRATLLKQAGVENAAELLTMDEEQLRQHMAKTSISATTEWQGLEKEAGNKDNDINVAREGSQWQGLEKEAGNQDNNSNIPIIAASQWQGLEKEAGNSKNDLNIARSGTHWQGLEKEADNKNDLI